MIFYLVVPAEGVEREGAEDGVVLEEAVPQLAQCDGEILEHGVGLAHHVHPLQEQPLVTDSRGSCSVPPVTH